MITIQAAVRIRDLVRELKLDVNQMYVIVNRTRNGVPDAVQETLDRAGLALAGWGSRRQT